MPSPRPDSHTAAREAAGRRLWVYLLAPDDSPTPNQGTNAVTVTATQETKEAQRTTT